MKLGFMISNIKKSFTEYYLIGSVLFYWFFTASIFNPVAIGLLIILGLQLVYQKKGMGFTIGSIFLLLNLFMVLALLSELREFTEFSSSFYELLIVGSLYLGLNILVSLGMIVKYARLLTPSSCENKTV